MDSALFSIIIPFYNSSEYIEETILSLANQTYKNFEVICIDDNSEDGSFELAVALLKKYDLNGEVFRKPAQSKRGVSTARNFGVEKAGGEWICFLDSDDLFHKNKLEIAKTYLKAYPSGKCFYHASSNFLDGESIDLSQTPFETPFVSNGDLLDGQNPMNTPSVVLSKAFFEGLNGFDASLNGVEDYHLWLKIGKVEQWIFIPFTLTFYRTRAVSLMGGRRFEHYAIQSVNLLKKLDFLSSQDFGRVRTAVYRDLYTYYSNTSIKYYGYSSIFGGLFILIRNRHLVIALKVFYNKSKNLFLCWVFKVLRKGSKQNN